MNKKIRLTAIATVLLVLAGAAVLFWLGRDAAMKETTPSAAQAPASASSSPSQPPTGSGAPAVPAPASANPPSTISNPNNLPTMTGKEYEERLANDKEFALAVLKAQAEKDPQVRRYMKGFAAAMYPFELYGIVVDEKNVGLPDVTVVYKLGYPYGYGYTEEITTNSDKDGRFRIRDRANSLLLKRIRKVDFILQNNAVEGQSFGPRAERGNTSWFDYSTQDPYEIVMDSKNSR